ncbi:MAG: penicillin-binding transpeptidase domain-containing protein, partial [Lapillicoccus sp.]
ATGAIMQAGSTFKPFALIAALQQGISTKTLVSGASPYQVPNSTTRVPNEFNQSFGRVDLREGLAKSINTVFMRLNEQIGPTATKTAAIAAGIPAATPGLDDALVNVLGTASPHVLDVANAYATIAGNGVRATPYLVASVTSDTVSIDYQAPKSLTQAFSAEIAADTLDAMQRVTGPNGTASRASQLGRPVAGKTGTTDGHKSVWFTGVVPQLSVSIGMYKDVGGVPQELTNIGGINELSGNSIPLSIWLDFMRTATANLPVAGFPARAGIGDDKVTVTQSPTTTATTTTTTTPPSTTTSTTTTRTQPPTPTTPPATTTTKSPPPTTPPPSTTTTKGRVPAGGGPGVVVPPPGG